MKKSLFTLMLLLTIIACSSVKKTNDNSSQAQPSDTLAVPDSVYRFTVSFISIGSGIDFKMRDQFMDYIQQFNKNNNVTLGVEKSNWGREGEVDFCFKLQGLSSEVQVQFINDTKEFLKGSTRIRYRENSVCRINKRIENK